MRLERRATITGSTGSSIVYIMTGFTPHASHMKTLGKHTTGKSCLYVRRLGDIDLPTLELIIADSVRVKRSSS
ncbi:MAG: DUF1801 domain-containing protein [Acidobacteriota bacterium]|nr:DUF1801 domain-containing protein [Acidobacteriota bacterium]